VVERAHRVTWPIVVSTFEQLAQLCAGEPAWLLVRGQLVAPPGVRLWVGPGMRLEGLPGSQITCCGLECDARVSALLNLTLLWLDPEGGWIGNASFVWTNAGASAAEPVWPDALSMLLGFAMPSN
jgi:hypothetical protein